MRIAPDPNLPTPKAGDAYMARLVQRLTDLLRDVAKQLNGISEGGITFVTNAYTAAPTTGTWKQGDFIKNSAPAEAGAGGSKYIIHGWQCTASGTPGTWLECRFLTGN